MSTNKILFVLTSHSKIDRLSKPTGWYAPEVAHPFYVFREAGYTIEWASPAGGESPLDPSSVDAYKDDAEVKKFLADETGWKHTKVLKDVVKHVKFVDDYAAVFYPGGHGPMYDLPFDEESKKVIAGFYEAGKPTSAVCHAPAVLANVLLADGTHLVKGKKVTGFSNSEEEAVGLAEAMPYMLETRLGEVGAEYEKAGEDWAEHVVVDGNLVTGQNPASAKGVGEAVVKLLKA